MTTAPDPDPAPAGDPDPAAEAAALLAEAKARFVRLAPDRAGGLAISGKVPLELLVRLHDHRDALLALLRAEPRDPGASP